MPINISNQVISECLDAYGISVTKAQCDQVRSYISLLLKWNRSISLTAVTDEREILKFHFGESVFALSAVKGLHGRLADVGAGAGFPGFPLRIFREDIDLCLIESNAKKCAFLSEVVRELGLDRVRILRARFEEIGEFRGQLNAIVSRALGGYDELLKWSINSLAPGGKLIIWLGQDEALRISGNAGWDWQPPLGIPGSRRRFLLSGSPREDRSL